MLRIAKLKRAGQLPAQTKADGAIICRVATAYASRSWYNKMVWRTGEDRRPVFITIQWEGLRSAVSTEMMRCFTIELMRTMIETETDKKVAYLFIIVTQSHISFIFLMATWECFEICIDGVVVSAVTSPLCTKQNIAIINQTWDNTLCFQKLLFWVKLSLCVYVHFMYVNKVPCSARILCVQKFSLQKY